MVVRFGDVDRHGLEAACRAVLELDIGNGLHDDCVAGQAGHRSVLQNQDASGGPHGGRWELTVEDLDLLLSRSVLDRRDSLHGNGCVRDLAGNPQLGDRSRVRLGCVGGLAI